jgi:hypothetical protein
MAAFVARGSESTGGEAERCGERGFGGHPPTTITQFASAAAAMSATNVSSMQSPTASSLASTQVRAQDSKRYVARGSARQAERSEQRGRGGGSPRLPSASFPAVASRLQGKLSSAESGGARAAALTCD